jgi:hypothetical protein
VVTTGFLEIFKKFSSFFLLKTKINEFFQKILELLRKSCSRIITFFGLRRL